MRRHYTIVKGLTIITLIQLTLTLLVAVGWGLNLYKIITLNTPLAEWTAFELIRCLGVVVPPLGGLMGYL